MHLNLSGLLLCIGVNAINVFGFFLGARIGVNTCLYSYLRGFDLELLQ